MNFENRSTFAKVIIKHQGVYCLRHRVQSVFIAHHHTDYWRAILI